MTVSVVIPYRPGCAWRALALEWVTARFTDLGLTDIHLAPGPDGAFSRSSAILDAVAACTGDTLVVADADSWVDPTEAILRADSHGWAVPHTLIHRLSPQSTEQVLAGADWRGLPLSTDNPQDRKPYRGNETGTFVVLRRDVIEDVPPDRRFVGWGQEDSAWGAALRCLVGSPWRGPADLVHLWHPAQPRQSRVIGSTESRALWVRYRAARRDPARMRALIEEAR